LFARCTPRAIWTGQPEGGQTGHLGVQDEAEPWSVCTPVSTSEMVLVLVLLATVTFDGLRVTSLWAHIEHVGEALLPLPGGARLVVLRTLGLVACPGLFLVLYLACCWGMGRASGTRQTTGEVARLFR